MQLTIPVNVKIKNLLFTEPKGRAAKKLDEERAVYEVRRAINVWASKGDTAREV